jgi:hypothetical protein
VTVLYHKLGCSLNLNLEYLGVEIASLNFGRFNISIADENSMKVFAAVFSEMEERRRAADEL